MQTQLQLGKCIHVCINETHSLANLQDLIPSYFDRYDYKQHNPTKVGIKFLDLLESVFYLCIHGCTYPAGLKLCLHDQLDS